MFLFKKHKKISHKQTSVIGFVLAIISTLVSVLLVYGLPVLVGLLNRSGVYHLDLFVLASMMVFFFSMQGLLLFGFPMSYVHDRKDPMAGFQIVVYTWLWLAVILLVISILSVFLFQTAPLSVQDFAPQTLETIQ